MVVVTLIAIVFATNGVTGNVLEYSFDEVDDVLEPWLGPLIGLERMVCG